MNALKDGLTPLPARMRSLPIDERGYCVPWFVAWPDGPTGKPEFRQMDTHKFVAAIKRKLCWVCGEKLGVNMAFVVGPMCGINRTSSEPPSHRDCAEWSAINCPFLSNPKMVRREDDMINNAHLIETSAGIASPRNPGVAMVWLTREYEVYKPELNGSQGYLIEMGDPTEVLWYREGRRATRAEVQESVDTGMLKLESTARLQEGGFEALQRAYRIFERYLPLEAAAL